MSYFTWGLFDCTHMYSRYHVTIGYLFQQITLSSYYVQDTDKFFSHMITGVHCNPQIGCEALNCTVQSRFQT